MKYKVLATAVGLTAFLTLIYGIACFIVVVIFNDPVSENYQQYYTVGDVMVEAFQQTAILAGFLGVCVALIGGIVGTIILVCTIWDKG